MSVSGIKAGRAFVLIDAVDKASPVMNTVGRNFEKLGKNIGRMGRQIMTQSLIAITPTFFSNKVFMEFDDAMRKIEARSQGTAREMEELREQAKRLGRETAFTAGEIGELQMRIGQKGFNRKQIKDMTEAIMALARAGGEGFDFTADANAAAELVTGVLRAYHLEAREAGRVADIMAAAVNNSNFRLEGLITAMQYAETVAHNFNLSIEETVALLGMMVNLNIDPSISGTALRNMSLYASNPNLREEFNQQLAELTGKQIDFVDAEGNLRPIMDLLFAIEDVTKDLGSAQRADLFATLFGVRAMVPAMGISAAAKEYDRLLEILENSHGSAAKAQKIMEEGLGGAWREFLSATEGVALAVGESLAPALIGLSHIVNDLLGNLARFISENPKVVIQFMMWTLVSLATGVAFITLGVSIKILSAIIYMLSFVVRVATTAFMLLQQLLIIHRAVVFGVTAAYRVLMLTVTAISLVLRGVVVPLAMLTFSARALSIALVGLNVALRAVSISMAVFKKLQFLAAFISAPQLILRVGAALTALGRTINTLAAIAGVFQGIMLGIRLGIDLLITRIAALNIGTKLYQMTLMSFKAVTALAGKALTFMLSPTGILIGLMAGLGYYLYQNRKTIFDNLSQRIKSARAELDYMSSGIAAWAKRSASNMQDAAITAARAWSGVSEALEAGNTQLAFEIGIEGMLTLWHYAMGTMMDGWSGLVNYILESWSGVSTAVSENIMEAFLGPNNAGVREFFNAFGLTMGVPGLGDTLAPKYAQEEAKLNKKLEESNKRLEAMGLNTGGGRGQSNTLEDIKREQWEKHNAKVAEAEAKREAARKEHEIELNKKKEELDRKVAQAMKEASDRRLKAQQEMEIEAALAEAELERKLKRQTDDLIKNVETQVVSPKALEGMQRGSKDALKQAFENAMRGEGGQEKAEKQRDDMLKKLDRLIQIQESLDLMGVV